MTLRAAALLTFLSVLLVVPASALGGTRTINFDDVAAPSLFADAEPLRDRYAASHGVTFRGPSPTDGGAILNEGAGFGVTGHSPPNFLAFNTTANYGGGGTARGPETIGFHRAAHSFSIKAGQNTGGTVTVTAFDGETPVAESFRTSTPAMATLSVSAARITSVRLAFTGTGIVFDDMTWGSAPVSPDDAFGTKENTPLSVPAKGVLANDTDADGDALTATLRRAPANGDVALNGDGSFNYTPKAGFSGTDSFVYRASDGTGSGPDATVTVSVEDVPDPPPPPPPTPIVPTTTGITALAFPSFTRIQRLVARNLVAGSKVRVTCRTKRRRQQRKGCPYRSKRYSLTGARTSLNLRRPYRKRRVPAGSKITITVTAPGFVGKRIQYRIRKGKLPRSSVLCVPPGGKPGPCS